MKKQLVLAAACCLPLSLMAQKGFTLRGKIGKIGAPAVAYIEYAKDGVKVEDSAALKNGEFTFKGSLNAPTSASLRVKYDTITDYRRSKMDYFSLYLENGNITITAPDSMRGAVVKGSKSNEEDVLLNAMRRPYKRSADSLVAVYNKLSPEARKDTSFTRPAGVIMRETQAGYDSVSRVFIASHPNSVIALRVFREIELGYNYNPDTAEVRFRKFTGSVRNSYAGKQAAAFIEIGKNTNIGRIAMDFEQADTTGKMVKLSDYRGKYVLVDFWASWCKPCRAENPNLLAAYNKFKDKNFTVLGVSLDSEDGRRAWLGAVKQDGLPWTQVSELKGFESKAAVQYGVKAIPTNFLIDPQGKIVGKNLRDKELHTALAKILQ